MDPLVRPRVEIQARTDSITTKIATAIPACLVRSFDQANKTATTRTGRKFRIGSLNCALASRSNARAAASSESKGPMNCFAPLTEMRAFQPPRPLGCTPARA